MDETTVSRQAYRIWMSRVNALLGIDAADLPDYCWYDLFDGGLQPSEAIQVYLDEYGDDLGMDE